MGSHIETTVRTPEAFLLTSFALRTAVAIDTFGVIAVQSKTARSHASNRLQDDTLIFGQFMSVIVIAAYVWAFAKKEIDVA